MSTALQYSIDALSLGSLYALLALGVALLFGVMGLVNFAHGELIAVGAYALYVSLERGWSTAASIALAIATVVVVAVLMDRVAFRPVRGADLATLLITSFALSYFIQNLAIMVFGSRAKSADMGQFFLQQVSLGDIRVSKLSLLTIGLTAVLLFGLVIFLRSTTLGLEMRAAAEDFEMARLVGVRANRVIAAAFVLSGLLAAVAAVLILGQTGVLSPTVGRVPVIAAFIATILGGMGSLSGAVLGGFLLGVLTTALQILLPPELRAYRDAFVYAGVIIILVVRPQGLIVPRTRTVRV